MIKYVITRYPLIATPMYWIDVALSSLIESDAAAYSYAGVMTAIYLGGLVMWWKHGDDRLTPPESGDSHEYMLVA